MIKTQNKGILIWIIVILAVTNISTLGTIIYHSCFQEDIVQENSPEPINIPDGYLGRFFRDELKLNFEQHQQFRTFRQHFHQEANLVTDKMNINRKELMLELGKEKSDTAYLEKLAEEIGDLHADLKHLTFGYYLEMKNVCTEEQKEKLFQIFSSMTNQGAEMEMPDTRQNPFQKKSSVENPGRKQFDSSKRADLE